MKEIKIQKNDAGQRLDKFLTKALDLPQSLLYKSIRTKKIKCNRRRAEPNQILVEGDVLQCFLPPDMLEKKATTHAFSSIKVHLDIVYEDEHLMLVNKPVGLSVHEDETTEVNTLITYIQTYLYQKGEYDPEAEQSFAPALCNRIDRNTSGIVIAAKTAEALRVMNEKIKNREIDKFYLCAVHGVPNPKSALLTGYLIKDEKSNTVKVYDKNPPRGAKTIKTRYTVLQAKGDSALCEVELLTGRTHQIRAHMAHIGHPLIGDGKYGHNKEDRERGQKYQALCSYKLRFSFVGEPTALDYLNHKEFKLSKDSIPFALPYFEHKNR